MITLKKQPYWWTPAHAPVIFEFEYQTESHILGEVVTTGKVGMYALQPFGEIPKVGQLVYIRSGNYKGYHVVKSYNTLSPGLLELETDYEGYSDTYEVSLITRHEFELWTGFQDGELFEDVLPFQKVASFIPEPNSEGKLKLNLCGYLKGIFDPTDYKDLNADNIHPNLQWATGLFNKYWLFSKALDLQNREIGAKWLVNNRMVLNAACEPDELFKHYWGTDAKLTKELPSVIFQSCDTMAMSLETAGVLLTTYDAGNPFYGPVTFTDSFTNSFKK